MPLFEITNFLYSWDFKVTETSFGFYGRLAAYIILKSGLPEG